MSDPLTPEKRSQLMARVKTKNTAPYAQHIKHSETPTRREAGIAADAVIQLANLLRRLDEDQ